jgi:hypothetical protein
MLLTHQPQASAVEYAHPRRAVAKSQTKIPDSPWKRKIAGYNNRLNRPKNNTFFAG